MIIDIPMTLCMCIQTSNPSSAFTSVEIPQIQYIFVMETYGDSGEYITFDNLELAYVEKLGI